MSLRYDELARHLHVSRSRTVFLIGRTGRYSRFSDFIIPIGINYSADYH